MTEFSKVPTYGHCARILRTNGYRPIPVRRGSKKPCLPKWPLLCARDLPSRELEDLARRYADDSVALAGGNIVAVDIDSLDEERVAYLKDLTFRVCGETPLIRVGRAPKCALIYRAATAGIRTRRCGDFEIIADKAYILAFGMHPSTGKPYEWLSASPLTVALTELRAVGDEQIETLIARVKGENGSTYTPLGTAIKSTVVTTATTIMPVRAGAWVTNALGMVTDGRDSYLAHLAWKFAQLTPTDVVAIAQKAWLEFSESADLARNRRDGSCQWSYADAFAKAKYLVASNKVARPSRTSSTESGKETLWTPATKHAFANKIAQAGSYRKLSPSAVRVSNLMLAVVHGSGVCFLSTETIASQTQLAVDTVKKSRRILVEQGFWIRSEAVGGRGIVACYQPNPAVLGRDFSELSRKQSLETEPISSSIILVPDEAKWIELLHPQFSRKRSDSNGA
ncbi:bifunctional DNA primase/polymerase [Methylocystis echinoides]|uniref:DNA primase/polymerase bifunctional N-terminal domain-containing protein n=1 Tax=Methylocystis echinoides TaxID=29468 RepID=A0A9W6GXK6_9HYPH|nr:bifunctional DNA primase/polymerase [Methylocystis echinoides]GLI94680.1 hypothetical protein LMG27198_36720 [Methylocystis echinoides]